MTVFNIEKFVLDLRDAARSADALKPVRMLMKEAFKNPQAIKSEMSDFSGDDEILFEDDTVSIWYCRFDPKIHIPPHNHQTAATIGVYEGVECNHLYLPENGKLKLKSTKILTAGDVMSMGPNAIHSVETADENYTYGIHVYLDKLTTISRSLFDWDSGEACNFNDDEYCRMQRVSKR